MTNWRMKGLAGGLVGLLLGLGIAQGSWASPIELLPGRWTGWGEMTLDGGAVEKVKCIATYFSDDGGRELRHNLRCASTNYRINAAARLSVMRGKVTGKWEERTYSNSGAVSGDVVRDGISVNIVGEAFEASLKVETSKCRQTMNILPKGIGVTRIAVDLAKC